MGVPGLRSSEEIPRYPRCKDALPSSRLCGAHACGPPYRGGWLSRPGRRGHRGDVLLYRTRSYPTGLLVGHAGHCVQGNIVPYPEDPHPASPEPVDPSWTQRMTAGSPVMCIYLCTPGSAYRSIGASSSEGGSILIILGAFTTHTQRKERAESPPPSDTAQGAPL